MTGTHRARTFPQRVVAAGTVAAILLSFAIILEASDSSTVGYSTNQQITAHSTCKKVTNSSGTSLSVYVPTVTSAEWSSFYTNPPSGVTAAICTCPRPWGGTINDGSSLTAYQAANHATCPNQTRTCTDGTLSGTYTFQSCLKTCATPWGTNINSGSSVTAYSQSSVSVGVCSSQTRTCTDGTLSGTYQYQSCSCAGKMCSDARLKTQVSALSDARGIDAILNLKPVLFRWKDVNQDAAEGPQIGFIAQDLEQVFPEVVNTNDGVIEVRLGNGETEIVANPKTVQYANLVAPLVKAIQQLDAENTDLKEKLESLERRMERIEESGN